MYRNPFLTLRARTVAAWSLAVIGSVAACDADRRPTGPEDSVSPLIVSDPAPGVLLPSGDLAVLAYANGNDPSLAGGSGTTVHVAFISLPPGTVPAGTHATLRNRRMGLTVTVQMVAGGFDPVGIPAGDNDTVEIEVHRAGDLAPLVFAQSVPRRRPPRVVRTYPPPGKRDVALNSSIVVVFSEPMDARTITDQSVQLLHGTTPVAGRIEFDRNHMTASFVPNEPLAATTEYQLVVSRDVRDLDGDALEEVVASEFTTAEAPPEEDVLGTLHLKTTTTGVDLPDDHVVRLHGASRDTFVIVGVNATPEIRLPLGDYTVALESSRVNGGQLAYNCETVGPSSHNVTVPRGGSAATEFVLGCAPAPLLAFVRTSINEVIEHTGQTYGGEIYTIKTNGTAATGLGVYTEETPAWSPDGSRLAFTSGSDIYVINADGSAQARLTNDPSLDSFRSWSPDGSKIGFTSVRDGTLEVYVMNADGTNPTRLTSLDSVSEPAWSRDWSKIAFARSGDIYVMNSDGTSITRLTSLGSSGQPAWSPDGTKIAFVRFTSVVIPNQNNGGYSGNIDDSDLYVMNADGSDVTLVASGSDEGFYIFGADFLSATYTAPAWSPDGRWLAFTHSLCDPTFYGCFLHTVELREVKGRRMHTLAEGSRPAWRP